MGIIRTQLEAKDIAQDKGHSMDHWTDHDHISVSRCLDCGAMLYAEDDRYDGDAIDGYCDRSVTLDTMIYVQEQCEDNGHNMTDWEIEPMSAKATCRDCAMTAYISSPSVLNEDVKVSGDAPRVQCDAPDYYMRLIDNVLHFGIKDCYCVRYDDTDTCSRCNQTGIERVDRCDKLPLRMLQSLPIRVYHSRRNQSTNERLFGFGCVASVTDYGDHKLLTDQEFIDKVASDYRFIAGSVQALKVINDDNELADHLGIFTHQRGYSVRPVWKE